MASISVVSSDQSTPAYMDPVYADMVPQWEMTDNLLGGTEAMRKGAETYLIKNPSENAEEYTARLNRAELFNGLRRALNGLTGQVFRTPVAFSDDADEQLLQAQSNIDGAGSTLHSFARNLFYKALGYGHMGVLVDFPKVADASKLTLADERDRGLRPYWITYHPRNILNWRSELVDSQEVLTQLTLRDQLLGPAGRFGTSKEYVYNVYRLELENGDVTYQRWIKGAQGKLAPEDEPAVITNQTRIPFVPLYVGAQLDVLYSQTPMLDLMYTNIAHWNVQSDHRHSLHTASVPIPIFEGLTEKQKKMELGPNIGIHIPKGGKAYFMEHEGKAIGATRTELRDLEARMLMHAMGMMEKSTNVAETAEARRLDRDEQDSVLADAARELHGVLERCGRFHLNYSNAKDAKVGVEVNTDFENAEMTVAEMEQYSKVVERGQMSRERMWSMFERGGRLGEDFDAVEEARRLDDETLPPTGDLLVGDE